MTLTMRQKIETMLVMRDMNKTELEARSGLSRWKMGRLDGMQDSLSCAELWHIADCLKAQIHIVIRFEEGVTERPLACRRGDVQVSATQLSEIFGAEADLVFVLEDIGKRV